MAVINRTDRNLLASPRLRVAAGVIRSAAPRNVAVEIDAAYARRAADADYRVELIADYIAACRNSDDEFTEYRILAEAVRYDREHPDDAVSLVDELHGTQLRRAA